MSPLLVVAGCLDCVFVCESKRNALSQCVHAVLFIFEEETRTPASHEPTRATHSQVNEALPALHASAFRERSEGRVSVFSFAEATQQRRGDCRCLLEEELRKLSWTRKREKRKTKQKKENEITKFEICKKVKVTRTCKSLSDTTGMRRATRARRAPRSCDRYTTGMRQPSTCIAHAHGMHVACPSYASCPRVNRNDGHTTGMPCAYDSHIANPSFQNVLQGSQSLHVRCTAYHIPKTKHRLCTGYAQKYATCAVRVVYVQQAQERFFTLHSKSGTCTVIVNNPFERRHVQFPCTHILFTVARRSMTAAQQVDTQPLTDAHRHMHACERGAGQKARRSEQCTLALYLCQTCTLHNMHAHQWRHAQRGYGAAGVHACMYVSTLVCGYVSVARDERETRANPSCTWNSM